jgi:hypothetical protein
VVYHGVTTALGGTPTAEGLGLSQAWGGIAAGVGYSIGSVAGARSVTVKVRHYTSRSTAEIIERDGVLLDKRFVTFPDEIPQGASQAEIESLLGLRPGRAEMYIDLRMHHSVLEIPKSGYFTQGGAIQYVLVGDVKLGFSGFVPFWKW